MAINDVTGGGVYHEFLGHNFVSFLCTLKPRKPNNLKTFSNKPSFFPALVKRCTDQRMFNLEAG